MPNLSFHWRQTLRLKKKKNLICYKISEREIEKIKCIFLLSQVPYIYALGEPWSVLQCLLVYIENISSKIYSLQNIPKYICGQGQNQQYLKGIIISIVVLSSSLHLFLLHVGLDWLCNLNHMDYESVNHICRLVPRRTGLCIGDLSLYKIHFPVSYEFDWFHVILIECDSVKLAWCVNAI